jgi:hypothetical protein
MTPSSEFPPQTPVQDETVTPRSGFRHERFEVPLA